MTSLDNLREAIAHLSAAELHRASVIIAEQMIVRYRPPSTVCTAAEYIEAAAIPLADSLSYFASNGLTSHAQTQEVQRPKSQSAVGEKAVP
jgi:hypothetical protein